MKSLTFHSFIHYFEEVVEENRVNTVLIESSVKKLVSEFSHIIYRGDDTVDCATCKIHSHLHLSADIENFGHPMNWEAGKGERGLKVWAKMASCTAQKVRLSTFTFQTAQRVGDAAVLSSFLQLHGPPDHLSVATSIVNVTTPLASVRHHPHYLIQLNTRQIRPVSVRGVVGVLMEVSPFNVRVIDFLKLQEGCQCAQGTIETL